MSGRILPYSAADTAQAAEFLPFLSLALEACCADHDPTADELHAAAVEESDKLARRGVITWGAAALLAEIFEPDTIPAECLALA